MALSPQEITLYTQRLSEARAALHKLSIGGMPIRIQDQSGESVTYSTANLGRLRTYIKELEAILAGSTTDLSSGPIRPQFL